MSFSKQVQAFAGALYGVQIGTTTMAQVTNDIASVNGLEQALNIYYKASFSGVPTATVAATMAANLGLTGAALTEGTNYITARLNAAPADERGAVIADILNLFAGLTSDPTYGAAATAWNAKVATAFAYTGTADVPMGTTATQGSNFNLTKGIDTVVGTANNDTINSTQVEDNVGNYKDTLTALDNIDGGDGNDTINVISTADIADPTTSTIQNVETANLVSAENVTATTTGWTGLTALNVKQAEDVTLTAAASTAVAVSGAKGAVTVDGGSTVNVTTAGTTIELGSTTGAAGAITVSHTKQANHSISVDGGTTVALTTAGVTSGTSNIGNNGTSPTGAVTVNVTGAAYEAATPSTLGQISVTGGTTVNVTQTAASSTTAAATDTAAETVTQGQVTVNGTAITTAVTVTQNAAVAPVNAVSAVAAVTESGSAVFSALTSGQTLTVGGLTFSAGSAGTTAAQTAAAFANLAAGAIQGTSTLGTYSGALTGWTSAAASGTGSTTVVFSSTAAGPQDDLVFTGTGTAPALTKTQGVTAIKAVTGVMGVAAGSVVVTDYGYNDASKADSITTVTLDSYGNSIVMSDALTTVSLANSASAFTASNNTATTLGLTLNKVTGMVNLDAGAAKYTTLNVTTAGTKSASAVTAAAVTALTVSGTAALDLTGSTLSALKTVTVSGAAGLTVDASGSTVTSVDTSASTGANSISVDATKATYTGGAGADTVTTTAAAPSKAISLGDGNDKLTLAAGTTSVTGAISGGNGEDTLSMVSANAAAADDSAAFATAVTGFEVLELTGAAGNDTVDLAALGNFSKVSAAAGTNSLTLNNFVNGGTLTMTGNGATYGVNVKDAATGAADVVNLVLRKAGALTAGTVTAANVESVTIAANDTTADVVAGTNPHTLTLVATKATSLTVTGNAKLTLTNTGNTALTSIDASAMTGALIVTTAGTVAETVKGGSGADELTAATGTVADTLIGNDGKDTLISNAGLTTLTGGAGADTFVVQTPSANVNVYTTITDASAGDTIKLAIQGDETFAKTKLSLGDTAVFQDYANLAAAGDASVNGKISWFQFGGNTYVVQDLADVTVGGPTDGTSFTNNKDIIVKLTGLVDLSTASLNNGTVTTLLLA